MTEKHLAQTDKLDRIIAGLGPAARRIFHIAKFLIPLLALWLVWHQLHEISYTSISTQFGTAKKWPLFTAGILSIIVVAILGLYDAVAFRLLSHNHSLTFYRRWLLGTVIFAWSNLIGFGPALRALVYTKYGYNLREVSRGMASLYLGVVCGLIAWLAAILLPLGSVVFTVLVAAAGSVLLTMLAGQFIVWLKSKTQLELNLNHQPYALLGLIAFAEWGLSLTVYFLIYYAFSAAPVDMLQMARAALLGWGGGFVSMIPGGLGAADAIWLHQLSSLLSSSDRAAAMVVCVRTLFYIFPWFAALLAMCWFVFRERENTLHWQRRIIAGALVVQAGILLFSAATPIQAENMHLLSRYIPLPVLESAHALIAIMAITFLFLIRGIARGYKAAYWIVLIALAFLFIANLLKGIDIFESISCVVLASMLFGARKSFVRQGNIPIGSLNALKAGFGGLIFFWVIGLAAFKTVPYQPDLWTEFAFTADASRFIRVSLMLFLIVVAFNVIEVIRPSKRRYLPEPSSIQKAEIFATQYSSSADPLLVGGGDKAIWWFADKGFLLYQGQGDKIFVFKDPVLAPDVDPEEFLAAFFTYCAEEDMEPVFSLMSLSWMEHLNGMGFHYLKVAEEAIVDLNDYSLLGNAKAEFRRTIRDVERQGVTFEVIAPPFSAELLDALARVSDFWLETKGGHEMQFSACYYSAAYIARNPLGIVRASDNEIIAFVNFLCIRNSGTATIDFMRYIPDRVDNIMDYILLKSQINLAWEGYTNFSLGTAPMTEENRANVLLWLEKIINRVAFNVEHIYNYQALRQYKSKFKPSWHPRYLAYQYPWEAVPIVALNASLVQARARHDKQKIAKARNTVLFPAVGETKPA